MTESFDLETHLTIKPDTFKKSQEDFESIINLELAIMHKDSREALMYEYLLRKAGI